MKVVLTNLSNKLYEQSRFVLNESARQFGIHEVISYDFDDLKQTSFYLENKAILDQPRGIGYWLWKSYIISEAMKDLSEGDVVIYSDCGIKIIADLSPLIDICRSQQPIVLFANGDFVNAGWTKRDCFILMGCDTELYWNSAHCDAAFGLFRKSDIAERFVSDWMKFGSDARIITDMPNTCGKPNLPEYVEHRWDQSILSLLAHLYKLPLYRMPTQFGNHYKAPAFRIAKEYNTVNQLIRKQVNYYATDFFANSPYFQLLEHHRSKDGKPEPLSSKLVKKIRGLAGGMSKRVRRALGLKS